MESASIAMVPVIFIEDRGRRALVRLPNGSKTSLAYASLTKTGARGHFVADPDESAVTAVAIATGPTASRSGERVASAWLSMRRRVTANGMTGCSAARMALNL